MNEIKELFMRWRLKRHKERALYEVGQDLIYLMTFKKGALEYDEDKGRKRMAELKAMESRSDKEEAELDNVINMISESKAVKNEVEQSKRLQADLTNYISIL
jgi:hypothetical protein